MRYYRSSRTLRWIVRGVGVLLVAWTWWRAYRSVSASYPGAWAGVAFGMGIMLAGFGAVMYAGQRGGRLQIYGLPFWQSRQSRWIPPVLVLLGIALFVTGILGGVLR